MAVTSLKPDTWMALRPDTRTAPIYLTVRCPHGWHTTRAIIPETWVLAPHIVVDALWQRFTTYCRGCAGPVPPLAGLFATAIDQPEMPVYRMIEELGERSIA